MVWHRAGNKPLSELMMAYFIDAYMRLSTSMIHCIISVAICNVAIYDLISAAYNVFKHSIYKKQVPSTSIVILSVNSILFHDKNIGIAIDWFSLVTMNRNFSSIPFDAWRYKIWQEIYDCIQINPFLIGDDWRHQDKSFYTSNDNRWHNKNKQLQFSWH